MSNNHKTIIITGGAGFIGSALVRHLINTTQHNVINIDCLTYAGNLENLLSINDNPRYQFLKLDIRNRVDICAAIQKYQPDLIMHLAAESHVDRSIDGPEDFIDTNIKGTFNLLEASRRYWQTLPTSKKSQFRFHHISTDEVYGSLGPTGLFTEQSPYQPNSPYSASKAASDHLVRAWHETYQLPVVVTNCSNNYGPFHYPEKLIPLTILNALEGKPIPIYGKGDQVRDWLYVEDHAKALFLAATEGKPGSTYNIGGFNEYQNIEVVRLICQILDELSPHHPKNIQRYEELITHVTDRPGHDQRYAIDSSKISKELGWKPIETFPSGLRKTIHWYLENLDWCQAVQKKFQRQRLGVISS